MMFKLTPFGLAAFLYLFANFVFLILAIFNNNFVFMEFTYFYIETKYLVLGFLLQVFSLLYVYIIYKGMSSKRLKSEEIYGSKVGYFLTFWQLLFFILAFFFGVGVVSSESNINSIVLTLMNFISADILYYLISPSLKSKKMFIINTVLYLISSIYRGWLGGVVLVFFVILSRFGFLKINIKYFSITLFIFLLLFFTSPLLIDLKFMIRGENAGIDFSNYGLKLKTAIDYLIGRFQHVGQVSVLLENAKNYNYLYEIGEIRPYWLEGSIQNFIYKFSGYEDSLTYAQVVAINDFGASFSNIWNVNTGLSGWFILLKEKTIIFLLYWFIILFIFYRFLLKYGNRQTFDIVSVFMVVYFFHGWLGAFFNLLILSFILIFFNKVRFK